MFEFSEIRCPRCKSSVPVGYIICPYCGYDLRPILRMQARQELTFRDYIRRLRDSVPLLGGVSLSEIFQELMIAPDLVGPFFIISAIAFFVSLMFTRFVLGLGVAATSLGFLYFPLLLLFSIVLMFILFSLYVAIVNWLLKLLGATPDFTTTASILGYSMWPAVFASFGALLISLAINPTSLAVDLSAALANPTLTLARYIMLGGILVSIALASEGISKAYHINRAISILIMALPVVLLFASI